jgi:hypothetical protein
MDEGKFAADFLSKNFETILKIGKAAFGKTDEIVQIKLKTAYLDYLKKAREKYAKAKSFFIRSEPVDLYSYYVPTGIASRTQEFKSPTFDQCIDHSKRWVLMGSGGSGKSVLFRHLFLDCMRDGRYAPILVELRELNSEEQDLDGLIMYTLDSFGFKTSGDYVKRAKEAGHFCFFFDGFDEVNHSLRDGLIKKVRAMSRRFSECPIFISSRSDDTFNGIEEFSVFQMLPLDLDSAVTLVEKLPFDNEIKCKFVFDLRADMFAKHESFLSNPLLLSIMLLTYGENAEIPSKLSIFYNQAYEALFQRHDANKGGYSRKRLTPLDIQDFSRVFSLFALQTYERRLFKMSRTACLIYIEKSKERLRKEFNSEDYLADLLSAACLLVEDGLEIAFSHRSFQEYFVALHISGAPYDVQVKLIQRYAENANSDNVVRLLLELNPDLVERELFVPTLEKIVADIGVKRAVRLTHHIQYLKRFYDYFGVEPDGVVAGIRNGKMGELAILRMAVAHGGLYVYPQMADTEEKDADIYDRFGHNDDHGNYPMKTIERYKDLLREIESFRGGFSSDYVKAVVKTLKMYKDRHNGTVEKLDALLGIN